VRSLAIGRTGVRLTALLLLVVAQTSLANPFVDDFIGVLSTGDHVVLVDSATVLDMGGGSTSYQTTDWGGDTGIVDTFSFLPPPDREPVAVILFLRQDDSAFLFSVPSLAPDSWYAIPGEQTQASVLFAVIYSGLEEGRRLLPGRAGLTISPSIFRAGADLRAEGVTRTTCAFVLFDAAGNRVRTLRTQTWSGTATATWNGTDDFGHRLPDGIYYCCLDDPANATARKLILTR